MADITEKTKVPLLMLLGLLGVVATGGVVWGQTASRVSTVEAQLSALKEDTKEAKKVQEEQALRVEKNEAVQGNMLDLLKEIKNDVKEIKRGR